MELNKVIQGDCLEVLRNMSDKSVDLVLTDPPYGIGISGKVGGGSFRALSKDFGNITWDEKIPSVDYFKELIRVSRNQIIFGGNYFIDHLHNTRCFITWYKRDGLPDRTFADSELAWTSFDRNSKVYNLRHDGFIRDSKDVKYHPTQKPTELFIKILMDFSNENDIILDPFLGSGTTAIACIKTNRNYIGIEKEPKYVEIANKRIQDELSQLNLELK